MKTPCRHLGILSFQIVLLPFHQQVRDPLTVDLSKQEEIDTNSDICFCASSSLAP